MAEHYSDPQRANDPHALPDLETFYIDGKGMSIITEDGDPLPKGWYYWPCFPGCLPDGAPSGPFATEAEALADARDGVED